MATYENDYSTHTLSLATAVTRKEIIEPGIPIGSVVVNSLPVAAVGKVALHFGPSGDPMKLRHESLPIVKIPARDDGLYLSVLAALPGEELEIWVGVDLGAQER